MTTSSIVIVGSSSSTAITDEAMSKDIVAKANISLSDFILFNNDLNYFT